MINQVKKIYFMKTFFLLLFTSVISLNSFAQKENETEDEIKGGFKKENLFMGGSVSLSFSNGTTGIGLSPYFGYSINKYIDVAASLNFNYISQRDYVQFGDKARQTIYGPGAFVRLFPLKFLFLQTQYEHNFIKFKYIPASNGSYLASTENREANSILVGGGYAGGRDEGNNSFYYFSILWDVGGNKNSPYVDQLNRANPIIRAGYNIALFQNSNRKEKTETRSGSKRGGF